MDVGAGSNCLVLSGDASTSGLRIRQCISQAAVLEETPGPRGGLRALYVQSGGTAGGFRATAGTASAEEAIGLWARLMPNVANRLIWSR
jgi:hypothetical protein